jgi:hypothetical protein
LLDKDNNVEKLSDKEAKIVEEILSTKTLEYRRPKALYYKDILLIVVHYLVIGEDIYIIVVKFIYYKSTNNKLKLYILS